jgi:2-isopropylmalate synthase
MALKTRHDHFSAITNINTKELMRTSRMVSDITSIPVQPNKAIVGANAFAHEAGIHQHGMLANRQTYEIMNPEDVGVGETKLVLGIHSGKHAILRKLLEMGYELDDAQLDMVVQRVKVVAEKKKEVTERDLESIVNDETSQVTEHYHLDYLLVVAGYDMVPTATIRLVCDGLPVTRAGIGVGPVDSIYQTISAMVDVPHTLVDYLVHSVTGGTDALGEVTVRISDEQGRIFLQWARFQYRYSGIQRQSLRPGAQPPLQPSADAASADGLRRGLVRIIHVDPDLIAVCSYGHLYESVIFTALVWWCSGDAG